MVVAAGPAGLMTAERIALAGRRVVVHDASPSPARKFLLAGRGGLNLTHSEPLEAEPLRRSRRAASSGALPAARMGGGARRRDLRRHERARVPEELQGDAALARLAQAPRRARRRAEIQNVALSCAAMRVRGEAVVTQSGLEGGAVYALSARLREAIDGEGAAMLAIDFDVAEAAFAARLARKPGQSVSTLLRKSAGRPGRGRAPARDRTGDKPDQSDATRMGELLRGWALQRVLQLRQRLGGEEGQAPSGACSETKASRGARSTPISC